MTTLYMALDRDGLTSPAGQIVGISGSAQGLIDAGYPAATYTGDRVVTIDTTDDSLWSNDCRPGWYYTSAGVVQATRPATQLETLHSLAHRIADSAEIVTAEGIRIRPGQDPAKGVQFDTWTWRGSQGRYLILTNQVTGEDFTIAERITWGTAYLMGPTDITGATLHERVVSYYTHFSGNSPTSAISWAMMDGTRTTLAGSVAIAGTVPANVDIISRDWFSDIQPGGSD